MFYRHFFVFIFLSYFMGITGCNQNSGPNVVPDIPATPAPDNSAPKTETPSPAPEAPISVKPTPAPISTPEGPPSPTPILDLDAKWRSYRAKYTLNTRNNKQVCSSTPNCGVWVDRLDPEYLEPRSSKIIPQLLAWNLILRKSDDMTVSVTVPVFADRGNSKMENGSLVYDFSDRVYVRGSGDYNLDLHFVVKDEPNKHTTLHLDMVGGGQSIHDDFDLLRIDGTELDDTPPGISPGVLAVYEFGQKASYYQGIKCSISYNPNSPYYIEAAVDVVIGQEETPAKGLRFKRDAVGLFASVKTLASSHGTVKSRPNARDKEYYTVFAQVEGKATEIPVYGSGLKEVINDASSEAIFDFKRAVKSLCDKAMSSSFH